MSDTPETDEQINGKPCTSFYVCAGDTLRDALVPSEFARKLERERDEAREDATNYYARIGELESERDELKEIVEQRILVGAEIHDRANSLIKQNDKTEAECERLRKQLNAATSALRQIHLEVGDWIRSTIIVEE